MIPGIIESARSVEPFSDTFDRANAADLATSTLLWEELTGDWQVDNNSAYTTTAASSYPMAVIDVQKADANLRSFSVGSNNSGFGVAFWVVDSQNWWAAVTESTVTSTTVSGYTCPNGGTLSGTTCIKTCTSTTSYYTGGTCPNNQSVTPDSNCICNDPGGCGCFPNEVGGPGCLCYSSPNGLGPDVCPSSNWLNGTCYDSVRSGVVAPYSYTGSGCTLVTSTSTFDCSYAATFSSTTVTTYNHTMRILKSVSGVVTQEGTVTFTNNTSDNYLDHLTVATVENLITVTGTRGTTVVSGSLSATNPNRGTKHGIILAPATRSQSARIDRFDYIN